MSHLQMVIDAVDSTQAELKRQFLKDPFLEDFSFVHAYEQSAGRGRQDRAWSSSRGNLYLSILLRGPFEAITWTPHRLAVAMAESLFQIGIPESRLRIKWPNDLVIDETRKIGGILCEKIGENIIAGIGVNVLLAPSGLDRPITSVNETLYPGAEERLGEEAIDQIRDQFLEALKRLTQPREVRKIYERYLLFKPGSALRWQDVGSREVQEGLFLRIGDFGELLVQVNDAERAEKKLFSEEVHLIR